MVLNFLCRSDVRENLICPSEIIVYLDPGQCEELIEYLVSASIACSRRLIQTSLPSGSFFPRDTTTNCFDLLDEMDSVATELHCLKKKVLLYLRK